MGAAVASALDYHRALDMLASGLGELGTVLYGAFAYGDAPQSGLPAGEAPQVAVYVHDEVFASRTEFTRTCRLLAGVWRNGVEAGLPRSARFHLFRRSETGSYPPEVALTLRQAAVPLGGAAVHQQVSWLKVCEAPRLHLMTNTVQHWRQTVWQGGASSGLGPGLLGPVAHLLRTFACAACGAAGHWCAGQDAVSTLHRTFPDLAAALGEQLTDTRPLLTIAKDGHVLRRVRSAALLFAEELSDRTLPLIRVPGAERTVEALRSAARAPAPVLTPEAEAAASRIRSRLRSALLCLLVVRTPFAPVTLVAVLDDLMPTPSLRLAELSPPGGVTGPPVLFLRQCELRMLGTGAHADQFLFQSHLYPYITTALFAGSRLLHGKEIRPTLPTPDRAAAVAALLTDLQFHLRSHLMVGPALTGVAPTLSAWAAQELDHLLALGLWLTGNDAIDAQDLRGSFFRTYPDFPHRTDVGAADFGRDHEQWCWAWEATAQWLKEKAQSSLPPGLAERVQV